MILKNNIISNSSGGVIILVALMFSVLVGVLGISIDVGRMYAVHSKLQAASDAALMGAVATSATTPVANEMVRLFNTNFPAGYMGSTVSGPNVSLTGPNQYLATTTVSVPSSIMQVFGSGTINLTIRSRVNGGFQLSPSQNLELAVVLDNATGTNITGERVAVRRLADLIFNGSASLPNVRFHIIPFGVDVNVGNNRVGWIQAAFVARYNLYSTLAGGGRGFISNRNADNPVSIHDDISDVAPTTELTRFRVPYGYNASGVNNPTGNPDYVTNRRLAPMRFGLNVNNDIRNALGAMRNTNGNRRTNVGLMWGWMSLSPNWQGLWSAGLPGLPAAYSPTVLKQMILVVTGQNNVYTGQPGQSNDNTTTAQLCQAIKNQGITLYTVGFGAPGSYNQVMLEGCASSPLFFYTAATDTELRRAFEEIANAIMSDTLILSE